MRKAVLIIILIIVAAALYLRKHQDILPLKSELQQLEGIKKKVNKIVKDANDRLSPNGESLKTSKAPHKAMSKPAPSGPKHSAASPATVSDPSKQVTVYLKNGGVVNAELSHETPQEIILRFDYGEVGFKRSEIERIDKGNQGASDKDIVLPWEGEHKKIKWPYQNDVVVKLNKGSVVDAKIASVSPQTVIMTQTLSTGGEIEHTVARADIEQLLFRPIRNARSEEIAQNLQTVFPNFQRYEEGMCTIITDSIPPTVKDYRRTVRELVTDFYLTFYPILKDRPPTVQQYIVVFDDWTKFIEYAATDGVPGWAVLGYFSPESEVLYLYNTLGENFSSLLYDVFLGSSRKTVDSAVNQVKGSVDSRYEASLDGIGTDIKKRFETAYSSLRQTYGQITVDTLRHELTHALFHNWKLQNIVLSKMAKEDQDTAKKKEEFLKETDMQKKRELLLGLLKRKAESDAPKMEMQAANSWVAEGLATYMEPSPVGGISSEWLSTAQEALRNKQILPIEFLNTFRMGSFPRVSDQARLYAYAQSWAFCSFLMNRYPEGFLAFLDKMAKNTPQDQEEELRWLLQDVGKELRVLEQEFTDYLSNFQPEDPPWLKETQIILDLDASLRSF